MTYTEYGMWFSRSEQIWRCATLPFAYVAGYFAHTQKNSAECLDSHEDFYTKDSS